MNFHDEVIRFLDSLDARFEISSDLIYISSPKKLTIKLMDEPVESDRNEGLIIHHHQWKSDKEQLKSRIRSKLGLTKRIHGRLTTVEHIDQNEAIDFLEQNHLTGGTKAKTYLGLRHRDGELVAVATFSKKRKMNEGHYSYELIRYANRLNETVVGGLDKVIQYFIELKSPGDIMTYVDLEQSQGAAFKRLGFEEVEKKDGLQYKIDKTTGLRIFPSRAERSEGLNKKQWPYITLGNLKLVKKV